MLGVWQSKMFAFCEPWESEITQFFLLIFSSHQWREINVGHHRCLPRHNVKQHSLLIASQQKYQEGQSLLSLYLHTFWEIPYTDIRDFKKSEPVWIFCKFFESVALLCSQKLVDSSTQELVLYWTGICESQLCSQHFAGEENQWFSPVLMPFCRMCEPANIHFLFHLAYPVAVGELFSYLEFENW